MMSVESWLASNQLISCPRYHARLTRARCLEYQSRRPEACSGCDGPPESAYVKAARARGEARKTFKACKHCGSRSKKVNRFGLCPTCNLKKHGWGP